jgi:putative membrane protein
MPGAASDAYCGPPPGPADLAGAWNLDPWLLAALALVALAYGIGAARAGAAVPSSARRRFAAGWALLAVAFVSPLCSLGVALFSARLAQHLLLVVAAAPLLAAGGAGAALRALLPRVGARRTTSNGATAAPAAGGRAGWRGALAAGAAFAVALWLWHAPRPYDATLRSDSLYWLMHATLLGSACWLWAALLRRGAAGATGGAALGLGTSLHMGLLGALLVFAPRPLYASHLATSGAWGLSPAADQALGGLLCWLPGCAVLAAAGLSALAGVVRDGDAAAAVAPPHR